MRKILRVALTGAIALMAVSVHAELNIIGDVIIQNDQQGQPPAKQPVRVISVPNPTRSAEQVEEKQDDGTPKPDTIKLLNEDLMRGSIVSIEPEGKGLRWQHPDVASAIDFSLKSVDRVTLGDASSTDADGAGSEVYLTNGDMLTGSIKALTADALTLSTWYAGDISLKRVMVERLRPSAKLSELIYEGPSSLASWTHKKSRNAPSWQYKDGALYALQSTPIGRQVPGMPDKARIEFNVGWRGYPQFYFAFFSDNIQHYSGNCYLLQVTGQSIYMQRYSSNSGSQNLGNANVERFQRPTIRSANFTLLVDKPEKKLVLLIDGEIIRQWNDPNPFGGLGSGILFQPQAQGNLKVDNIQISAWDGKMPTATEEGSEENEDRIHFVNSDKVSGTVKTIAEGQVSFDTAYATLTVPIERVSEISFSPSRTHRARRNKSDVRATFKNAGQVTLNLNKLDTGTIRGKSENFGDIQMPIRAFSEIEFNIYKDRKPKNENLIFN